MGTEKLWKATAKCQVCGKVLNTAVDVPESKKKNVELTAPLMAVCDVKGHSTFSDCNFAPVIEWEQQAQDS
jgi:hypothetical protein